MCKKITLCLSIALLMAGTVWAGGSLVTVDPGMTINTIWSGTNNTTFSLVGQMGNPAGAPNPLASTVNVWNSGGAYNGSANLVNTGDNPYGYLVNSTTSNIKAGFTGSGYAQFNLTRDSSYVPMYGPAGQVVSGYVSSDATGEMAMNINTNYANLVVADYGKPRTTNGKEFEATGNFYIQHAISDGAGNGAALVNSGSGSSQISAMSSSAGGALGGSPLAFTFGRGAGSYTDAKIVATGSGTVIESAGAGNQLSVWAGPYNNEVSYTIPGNGTPGSANYNLNIGYAGNFTLPNFSLSGN